MICQSVCGWLGKQKLKPPSRVSFRGSQSHTLYQPPAPPPFLSLYPLTTPNKFHFNSKWIKNATFRNWSQSRSRSWAKAGQGRARQDELCSSSETTVKRQASQILLISRGTTTTTTTTMGTTATTKGNNKKTMRKKQQSKGKARNWTAAQQQRDSGEKGVLQHVQQEYEERVGGGCKGARGHGASSWHKCQLFYTERFTQSMLMIMTMMMTAKRGMPIELVTAMLKKIGKCVKAAMRWGGEWE